MKCVICKSSDIKMKMVEEEVKLEKDIILIPMKVLVCVNCGERYYDRNAMRKIEEMRAKINQQDIKIEEIGKVYRTYAA